MVVAGVEGRVFLSICVNARPVSSPMLEFEPRKAKWNDWRVVMRLGAKANAKPVSSVACLEGVKCSGEFPH